MVKFLAPLHNGQAKVIDDRPDLSLDLVPLELPDFELDALISHHN